MPLVTHPSLLFDPAAAAEPATALEADLAAAWGRCRDAATADGGLTWPAGAAAADAGAGLAFVAAAAPPDAGAADAPAVALRALTAAPPAGATAACSALASLAGVHWRSLTPAVRARVAGAIAALVAARASGSDAAALAALRHVRSGCTSPANVELASSLITGLASAFDFVTARPALTHATLLACLRLLPELARLADAAPAIAALRDSATALAARLINEAWPVACGAGRDLVPALRDVSTLPPFDATWAALIDGYAAADDTDVPSTAPPASPAAPHALASLLATRTPPRALLSRLPPDAEAALYFMLTAVRSGNQRRYQSWYAARHVAMGGDDAPPDAAAAAAAADAAVADAVRFVVSVYHPPNTVLASDVLPRWAALGWLTQLPRGAGGAAAARAALVLDWLFYTPAADSFMNVEPAALLLVQSIPKYAAVTNGVLEFVSVAVDRFVPRAAARARRGLAAGADALVARGVLKSFDRLATAPEVAPELRDRVRELFGGVVSGGGVSGGEAPPPAAATAATTAKRRRAPSPPPADPPKKRKADDEKEKEEEKKEEKADEEPKPPKPAPPPPKPTASTPVDAALADLRTAATASPPRPEALVAAAAALLAAACPGKKPAASRRKNAAADAPPPLDAAAAGVTALANAAAAGRTTAPWSEPPDGKELGGADAATLCGALIAAALAPDAPPQEASAALFAALRSADACADVGWRLLGALVAAAEGDAAAVPPSPSSSSSTSTSATDAALTLYACSSPDPRAALEADVGAALAAAGPAAVARAAAPLLRALGEPAPLPALRLLLAAADARALLAVGADLATRRSWFVLPGEDEEEDGGRRKKKQGSSSALATSVSSFVAAADAWPAALAARGWRLLADDAGGRGALGAAAAAALEALASRAPRGSTLAAAAPAVAAAPPTPALVRAVLALPATAAPFALAVLGRWCGGGGGVVDDDETEPPAKKTKKGAATAKKGAPASKPASSSPPADNNAGVAAAAAALKAGLAVAGGGGKGATVGEVWGVAKDKG